MDLLAGAVDTHVHSAPDMATDFGQTTNPSPAEGFAQYVQGLLDQGFAEADVRRMPSDNARALLDV
jgi:hypothetical protein